MHKPSSNVQSSRSFQLNKQNRKATQNLNRNKPIFLDYHWSGYQFPSIESALCFRLVVLPPTRAGDGLWLKLFPHIWRIFIASCHSEGSGKTKYAGRAIVILRR